MQLRPQPGPQEMFLSSSADIVIYGGGAGGGKTMGLLMEPLRHVQNKKFGAVFFRRNTTQIRNEGGLWHESEGIYLGLGGRPRESTLDWDFPWGSRISFRHLEHEKTKFDWQGSQVPLFCFDELTHFSESQFWYMVSRNRSTCGVKPYIRATCNPDPDSWVADFISWWIDPESGYPIMERSGVLRYMIRVGNEIKWANTPEELFGYTMVDERGQEVPIPPKSVTFIPSLVTDNKALLRSNPDYMANLLALSSVQRERLLKGNWKIRATEGMINRGLFKVVDAHPKLIMTVRGWDLASTEVDGEGRIKRAATAGVKIGKTVDEEYVILHAVRDWLSPQGVLNLMVNTASADGRMVIGDGPQDPGQAGKSQAQFFMKKLAGYNYHFSPETGDKVTRAQPFIAQAEAGNVMVMRGAWNEAWFEEMESFPSSALKDQVDATSRAFNRLVNTTSYRIAL